MHFLPHKTFTPSQLKWKTILWQECILMCVQDTNKLIKRFLHISAVGQTLRRLLLIHGCYQLLSECEEGAGDFSPMIPLSLLSRVELGLVMVPQGLERLRGGRLVVLLSVEHGLSVQGDAVLLVSVEQGLIPWLVTEHWEEEDRGKG